jgi:cytochrome c2
MRMLPLVAAIAAAGSPVVFGIEADARRGAEFFVEQRCNSCHSVGGAVRASRAGSAPDLGARLDRDYTPAGIASRMWNHAPTMWGEMQKAGITPPAVSERQAADLMAFFYAAHYFDKPGDAARGKRAFESKRCAHCHAVSETGGKVGPPVAKWGEALTNPVALANAMWNHAPKMQSELAKGGMKWPQITSQELADMLVYLQNLPQVRSARLEFSMPEGSQGAQRFEEKGCSGCHKGALELTTRLQDMTLTDIAAAMWNHAPRMKEGGIPLTYDEMQSILGYLWAGPFFSARGDAERGKRVFESKSCASCHNNASSGAPQIVGRSGFSPVAMVSALWKHGPRMLERMKQQNIPWPQLTPSQMSDLVAYLATGETARAAR